MLKYRRSSFRKEIIHMKSSKLLLSLAIVPFLLVGCSKAGNEYYKQSVGQIKEQALAYLEDKGAHSSVYAPKEYTLTKLQVNYADAYMYQEQWACVINYTIKYDKLDVTTEKVEKEEETTFVFFSVMAGELTFDDDKVGNYNTLKDTAGSKHIIYEAQKY